MSVTVQFQDKMNQVEERTRQLLASLLQSAARAVEVTSGEIAVSFVDKASIQELNRIYRLQDRPTDVLSFPLEEDDLALNESVAWPPLLGDIVISVPTAQEQAVEYGHSYERELGFLLVH